MLMAIAAPGPTGPDEKYLKAIVDEWGDHAAYRQFAIAWVALSRAAGSGILVDYSPHPRAQLNPWGPRSFVKIPQPPPGGFRSASQARSFELRVKEVQEKNQQLLNALADQEKLLLRYDAARAEGRHGMPSTMKPSNPRAFTQPATRVSRRASEMVNPLMLAGTIGLTEGDRSFLTRTLKEAVERVSKPKVTAQTLARGVFEGPKFADVLAGGELPDRDEFKDRFAAGLDQHLKTQYPFTQGMPLKRAEYASGPAFDPKAAADRELVIAPTTACLRCHEVRASARRAPFEVIPPLAFDPLDNAARELWVKKTNDKHRVEVLTRLAERLVEDKDMPPEDSPEHALFRLKQPEAFDALKEFLTSELARAK